MLSVLVALGSLAFLFTDIVIKGYPAFQHTRSPRIALRSRAARVGPSPSEQALTAPTTRAC
ncbi:MAG: DUF3333 domain-containing protein [Gammaproteobacteria bacterium]|nr:DUF3333 domain-containing protein [Gammaproteobacteria bacterium]